MDVTRYLEPKSAAQHVFDQLAARATRPRFMVRDDGDWRAVTWKAYADQIRAIALFLDAAGLEPGDRAAIFGTNSVAWMSAALGIQAAAGVMVPIYPASTSKQAAYILGHSDAKVLFVGGEDQLTRVFEAWSSLDAVERVVVLDDTLDVMRVLRAVEPQPPAADVDKRVLPLCRAIATGAAAHSASPDRLTELLASVELEMPALMLYTSGTTGAPKGVPLTHLNVATNGRDWLESNAPLLEEGSVDLLWLPMSHIFGFGEACAGNMLGFVTYLCDPRSALPLLPEVRPNVFFSVPAYWEKLAGIALAEEDGDAQRQRLGELTGGRLGFCLSGGAGLKREVKELFYASGILLIEGYGLTECSPTLTLNRPDAFRFDSVGKPLPSVELRIADDGEILARGPSVFGGYHKNPEATEACFTDDGWFMTGDVGRMTDDGFLQITGRKKEILVTAGGKNVPPANIEQRFADDSMFAHVVVYGDGKKFLTAGVWLDPEALDARLAHEKVADGERDTAIERLVNEAMTRVNGDLASFEQIKKWRIMHAPLTVARGLLTSTLKVRRKKVYEVFGGQLEELYR